MIVLLHTFFVFSQYVFKTTKVLTESSREKYLKTICDSFGAKHSAALLCKSILAPTAERR